LIGYKNVIHIYMQMNRGMIIPIMEKYEKLLINNIGNMYDKYKFTLPIELWQIGKEVSDEAMDKLEKMKIKYNNRIIFKNVQDYTDEYEHWKGFQVKAFILKHTTFDEVILCDCDVTFSMNPEIIFNDENYINTGSFLFKDYKNHHPADADELTKRVNYIKSLLPEKNIFFPKEWDFVYENVYKPHIHSWYYVDSGVVYINKQKHADVVYTIYKLNYYWQDTYKYVYGDKETFWLAFVLNNKPYHINDAPGIDHVLDLNRIHCCNGNSLLTHIYKNIYCFSQKGYPLYES